MKWERKKKKKKKKKKFFFNPNDVDYRMSLEKKFSQIIFLNKRSMFVILALFVIWWNDFKNCF